MPCNGLLDGCDVPFVVFIFVLGGLFSIYPIITDLVQIPRMYFRIERIMRKALFATLVLYFSIIFLTLWRILKNGFINQGKILGRDPIVDFWHLDLFIVLLLIAFFTALFVILVLRYVYGKRYRF